MIPLTQNVTEANTRFFSYKQRFFSTQSRCCLTSLWIEFQMLLRCCLIHITIIILRYISYLVYFCPYLGLYVVFLWSKFHFQPNFFVINHITLLKQAHLFFVHFLEYILEYFIWIILHEWKKRNKLK